MKIENILNDTNKNEIYFKNQSNAFMKKINYKLLLFIILIIVNDIIYLFNSSFKMEQHNDNKKTNLENIDYNNPQRISLSKYLTDQLKLIFINEKTRPYLKEINKKRTFENRFPLIKELNCKSHFSEIELIAFLSFLNKNTTYFETGSGCSSLIAKYYTKRSYAVEGCKERYEQGIKNGLKDNLIFHNLKPDNSSCSFPGKNSNINDWKKYFQSYDKNFNADVILLDGLFKIATAMDIFDKINDDTILFIHEYQERPSYYILESYYDYVYHWGTLVAFVKKKNISSIPLEIQKNYWNNYL